MNSFDQNPYEPSHRPSDAFSFHEREVRTWGMLLHLSLLAGHVIPIAGLVVPILIWQLKKDELPEIDEHGRIVTNWIISSLIYWMLCVLLVFVVVGIPLLVMMGILCTVFPIIGGIKANSGEYWAYPGTFRFL